MALVEGYVIRIQRWIRRCLKRQHDKNYRDLMSKANIQFEEVGLLVGLLLIHVHHLALSMAVTVGQLVTVIDSLGRMLECHFLSLTEKQQLCWSGMMYVLHMDPEEGHSTCS